VIGFATLFFIGLLGSVHCVAMCGGISSALNLSLHKSQRENPVRLAMCIAAYQSGRIASYTLAGAVVAGLSGRMFSFVPDQRQLVYGNLLQAGVLVLLGLYLSGYWRGPFAVLESAGARFWQGLTPIRKRIFPVRGPAKAVAMGLVWGWLPCGLTYSALLSAMASGRAGTGALYMLIFGLGTLPALLGIAAVQQVLVTIRPGGVLRKSAGMIFVLIGLALGLGVWLRPTGQPLQPFAGITAFLQWCLG